MSGSLRGRFCAHGVDGGSDCDACRREMLQAQCQQARSALTAAGIGEGETLADGISELASRIADIGLLLADAREELAESKRRGAVTALRKAADELDAGTTVGILRSLTVDRLRGYAENIESGEVTP